jgi:hypothetical protein
MRALDGRKRPPNGTPPVQKLDMIGWTEDDAGCWIYNGRKDRDGYGLMDDLRGVPVFVHRIAYGKWVSAIPDGKVIMHSCDNPPCINPAHLSIGTQEENLHEVALKGRTKNQKKTHCHRGHEFTPDNTKIRASANGRPGRQCIQCSQINAARYAAAKRELQTTT